MSLQGKIVLVPGAAGALGKAVSLELGRRGATVVLIGRNVKVLEKHYDVLLAAGAPEPAIYPINFEGASQIDYEALADRMEQEFGGIDLLAWCIGYWHGLEPISNLEPPRWLTTFHVNCTAPWLLFRACFASLRSRKGSAIFPMAPAGVREMAFAGAYGAAQASLRNWVLSAAQENDRLFPYVFGVELPPLKSKLRLAAFPAEPLEKVMPAEQLVERYLEVLQGAPGICSLLAPDV